MKRPAVSKRKKGMVVWFMGKAGCGKTTYAEALARVLAKKGLETEVLDSHKLRDMSSDLGYGYDDRLKNVKRVAIIAGLLEKHGVCVLVANIAPFYEARDFIRKNLGCFVEVYLKAGMRTLRARRPIYALAEKGKMKHVIGVDLPYHEPRNPDIIIDTSRGNVDTGVDKVAGYLKKKGCI